MPSHVAHHSVMKTSTVKRPDACQHADKTIVLLIERVTLPRKKCCGFLEHLRQEAGVQHVRF